MKVILTGPGGVGKTVTAALLAETHVVEVYDADPYSALKKIFPGAEIYHPEKLIEPCIVDTTLIDRKGRAYYSILRENAGSWVVLITTPFRHKLESTKEILEDIKELGCVQVKGVVVTMATGEEEAQKVAERLGVSLVGWLPFSKELDTLLVGSDPISITSLNGSQKKKGDMDILAGIMKIGKRLGLQAKIKKVPKEKKKRSLFVFK